MAPTFEDFIQSHQFTFFVGQEGKSIVVHAAAIAATSPQLDALVNGEMGESETQCARIENVRVDDFIRFCEYAYRGDYTVPPWEELPPEPSLTSDKNQQNEDDDNWAFRAPLSNKEKKKGKKGRVTHFWEESVAAPEPAPDPMDYPPEIQVEHISRAPLRAEFDSRNYLKDGDPKALILQQFEPKANSSVNQNFTPVLLAHARLYCFAHFRLVASLKALTLEKLHKTLMNFKLYTERVGDIIELARYVYSNPDLPGRSNDGILDDLRNLVVEFIVCEIDIIGKCDEFVRYMEEGGEFVGNFWRMARNYMA